MIESNEIIAAAGVVISFILIVVTILVMDYLSKSTGRDTQKDIESVVELLEIVKKAYEDGKVTEKEYEKIKEALLIAKENIKPYSGIIKSIYEKIKAKLS